MRITTETGPVEVKTIQLLRTKIGFKLKLIDQRKLPFTFEYFETINLEKARRATTNMIVRGGPSYWSDRIVRIDIGSTDLGYNYYFSSNRIAR